MKEDFTDMFYLMDADFHDEGEGQKEQGKDDGRLNVRSDVTADVLIYIGLDKQKGIVSELLSARRKVEERTVVPGSAVSEGGVAFRPKPSTLPPPITCCSTIANNTVTAIEERDALIIIEPSGTSEGNVS